MKRSVPHGSRAPLAPVGRLLLLGAGLALGRRGNLVIYNAGSPEMGDDLVKAFRPGTRTSRSTSSAPAPAS